MRSIGLTCLCCLLPAAFAEAQADERWLIIASGSEADVESVGPALEPVREALVDQGARVLSPEEATASFEANESAPPATLSDRELARWETLSARAVDDLAEGNYRDALRKLEVTQQTARDATEALNRDPNRARAVFDSCLYLVRATLATESESKARGVARECRELVPRAEPSPYMHPPDVTNLIKRVDALQAKQTGELRVESAPSGCTARLNGVVLGETPTSIDHLFPGRYRVQVECDDDEAGRVHFVTVGVGKTQIAVDSRFGRAVVSRPRLATIYRSESAANANRVDDANRIARAVGARNALLVTPQSASVLELVAIRGGQVALVRVPFVAGAADKSILAQATETVTRGECLDFTGPKPVELACGDQKPSTKPLPSPVVERRRPRGQLISGLTLAGVGVAGLAAGYALLAPRSNAALDWIDDVDMGVTDGDAQQRWLNLRTGIIASASAGSAALVAAMPLALPNAEKTPWWAWVSGGLGVGLAAFSIAWGVTADPKPSTSCSSEAVTSVDVRSCVNNSKRTSVAVLTGLSAAPLLTMPLVYWLRPGRSRIEPAVDIGTSGAALRIRGRF